jgi:integrase
MRLLLSRVRRNHSESAGLQDGEAVPPSRTCMASARDYRALRDLALVDMLFATGMRVGEASSLDIRDFFVRVSSAA